MRKAGKEERKATGAVYEIVLCYSASAFLFGWLGFCRFEHGAYLWQWLRQLLPIHGYGLLITTFAETERGREDRQTDTPTPRSASRSRDKNGRGEKKKRRNAKEKENRGALMFRRCIFLLLLPLMLQFRTCLPNKKLLFILFLLLLHFRYRGAETVIFPFLLSFSHPCSSASGHGEKGGGGGRDRASSRNRNQ